MSKKMTIVLITTVAVLHLPVTFAQTPGDQDGEMDRRGMDRMDQDRGGQGMMGMGMGRMDENGDGTVSKVEFLRSHEKMFDKMDQDGDGTLSESEMERGQGMMGGGMMNR